MNTNAARLIEHDAPLEIEEISLAQPEDDEVLVDMLFAGINPVDRYNILGRINKDQALPRTLGVEGVGRVDGRLVLVSGHGLGVSRDGLWAHHALVPKTACFEVPATVDPRQAAAVGVAGVTAWRTVTELGQVRADDKVLVLGASGGVGSIIVSLARALGAKVWGQSRSKDHEEWIIDLGAERVIVSDAEDLKGSLHGFEPTVVFDPLGGDYTGAAISALGAHGRLVLFGTSVSPHGEIPLQELYRKGVSILGYGGLGEDEAVLDHAKIRTLQALAEGLLAIPIDSEFPLEKVNDAFERLGDSARQGKVVLDLGA